MPPYASLAERHDTGSSAPRAPSTRPTAERKPGRCACGRPLGPDGMCDRCRAMQRAVLWRAAHSGSEAPARAPSVVHDVLRTPGRPLDPSTRSEMEPRFSHDFSAVRVHDDARAAESARAVGALAYTVGEHVAFGDGGYAPGTPDGRRLLAHELAHVVQQSSVGNAGLQRLAVGAADGEHERQAEEAALRVLDGGSAPALADAPAGSLQRTKICSKRLEAPVIGWFFNHAYIDDTGQDDCLGSSMVGNYAIQQLVSGNFIRGCATKTDTSTDPQSHTPNVKECTPKPGVTDLSQCLRDAFNAYSEPSVYRNPLGPNSNTFAFTLANACCADSSDAGLGRVPGWGKPPAPPCDEEEPRVAECEPRSLGGGAFLGEDCIIRQGPGPKL